MNGNEYVEALFHPAPGMDEIIPGEACRLLLSRDSDSIDSIRARYQPTWRAFRSGLGGLLMPDGFSESDAKLLEQFCADRSGEGWEFSINHILRNGCGLLTSSEGYSYLAPAFLLPHLPLDVEAAKRLAAQLIDQWESIRDVLEQLPPDQYLGTFSDYLKTLPSWHNIGSNCVSLWESLAGPPDRFREYNEQCLPSSLERLAKAREELSPVELFLSYAYQSRANKARHVDWERRRCIGSFKRRVENDHKTATKWITRLESGEIR